jgi:osmotically-inducible protein OsmY
VVNEIVVRPSQRVQEIRKSIENALERRTKREVQDLRLTLQDGTVSVSGVVDSWTEKQAVLGAIRGTRGVRDVDDHLTLGC